jgi:hypothetical protein
MLEKINMVFPTLRNAVRWRVFRSLIVILLVLQVSAAYALPAGAHLKLCIGFNGHFDISLDECTAEPGRPPQPPGTVPHDEDRHDECLDIAVGCVSLEALHPSIAEVCVSTVKTINLNLPRAIGNAALSDSHLIFHPSNHSVLHFERGADISSSLDCLRTILLLI